MRYRNLNLSVPEQVVVKAVKDDLVVIDLQRGEYHSLNETGRAIWEHLTGAEDLDQLVDLLVVSFPAERSQVQGDVEELLDELLERELLVAGEE